MPRRNSYDDTFNGRADRSIKAILGESSEDGNFLRLKKMLLGVIKNELTPRQKQIIVLYYYKGLDTTTIGKQLGISQQAVSGLLARARQAIFRVMRYYMK